MSDLEVSFTIKKRPGARREPWLHCPWLKKSCCLLGVAASLGAGDFRPDFEKQVGRPQHWLARMESFGYQEAPIG